MVDAVDRALAALPHGGLAPADVLPAPPPGLELLSETHFLTMLWPPTAAATQAVERLVDAHAARIFPPERVERYRQRLQHMAYLTGLAGQPNFSALIATAAWGLAPGRALPPARQPFLRALLLKTVEHHVLGDDEDR